MKPFHLFLAASVAANVVLGTVAWKRFDASKAGIVNAAGTTVMPMPQGSAIPLQAGSTQSATASAIKANSFEAQRDRLITLGFPPDVVRSVVSALIAEPRFALMRAANAAVAQTPWWRRGPGVNVTTGEQEVELARLRKTARQETERLFGPEASLSEGQVERYEFLGHDKAVRLATLDLDYAELRRDAANDPANGPEQTKVLNDEYKRDLESLLDPAERASLDAVKSPTSYAMSLRYQFFPGTEAEYRATYVLQKEFDDKYTGGIPGGGPVANLGAAMQQLTKAYEQALGSDRFNEYMQSQRQEYRALMELQRRFDVPATAVDQVAKLQTETMVQSDKIGSDSTLDRPAKLAALQALAERAKSGVINSLGAELGDKFLKATSASWIDLLAKGSMYKAQVTGGTMTSNVGGPLPERPKAP